MKSGYTIAIYSNQQKYYKTYSASIIDGFGKARFYINITKSSLARLIHMMSDGKIDAKVTEVQE